MSADQEEPGEVQPMIAPESSIDKMIDRLYPELTVDDPDNTMASIRHPEDVPSASDPMFMDLIEEIEGADIDRRLSKIEDRLDEIWMMLEKVLRKIEAADAIRERIASRHNE